jgi:hypothetical protein
MTTPTSPVMIPVDAVLRTVNGTEYKATVYGQPTAAEHLIITPSFLLGGDIGYGYELRHAPTGVSLRGGDPSVLREIARRLAHLDWASVTRENFRGSAMATEAKTIIRELQFTDPSAVELPAHDGWGPDGKGKGLKRAALPLAGDLLADLQLAFSKVHGPDAVPHTLPDPGSPDGTRINPEWMRWSERQVHDFSPVYLLLVLHQLDPEVADSAAAFLADSWEAGDSIGEWAWEWHQALLKGESPDLPGVPQLGEMFTGGACQ